jgi:hypothetical protein
VEILESEKSALERERDQMQLDLDEAEGNLEKLAHELKE